MNVNAGFVGEILSHAKTSKFPPAELKTSFMVRVLGEDQVVCYHLMAFTSRNCLKRYPWFTKPLNLLLDVRHQQVPGEDLRHRAMLPSLGTCPALSLTLPSQGQTHKARIWQSNARNSPLSMKIQCRE